MIAFLASLRFSKSSTVPIIFPVCSWSVSPYGSSTSPVRVSSKSSPSTTSKNPPIIGPNITQTHITVKNSGVSIPTADIIIFFFSFLESFFNFLADSIVPAISPFLAAPTASRASLTPSAIPASSNSLLISSTPGTFSSWSDTTPIVLSTGAEFNIWESFPIDSPLVKYAAAPLPTAFKVFLVLESSTSPFSFICLPVSTLSPAFIFSWPFSSSLVGVVV